MDFNFYFRSRQGEMASLLKEIVSRESPTSNKKAVDICSAYVVEMLKKAGAKITRIPQKKIGDFYLAEYSARAPKEIEGQILILSHSDTVWPVGKIEKMPFYVSGNKVFGPGVLDMKSGLVMVIVALKTLRDLNIHPYKKIVVFVNSSEEKWNDVSSELIRNLARKSDCVLCLEPALPGGALKTQRKGRMVIRLEVQGKSAHGGTPEKGINAIEELLTQLRRINQLKSKDITMNLGLIGGGEEANIVAASAWAVLDFRFWKSLQKDKILKFFKNINPMRRGARIKFTIEGMTPPMEKNKASSDLFLLAKNIAASLNLALTAGKTGGGSDASIAASLGIPTLDGLGPDGNGIHSENEHVLLPSLVQRTALLTELLKQL
ncbi:MAG: M20 family metallopeptidase [Candidatus Aminicenantales bacterium]